MPDQPLHEIDGQLYAILHQALGAFSVLISTVATLPDHPSIDPVKELANQCRHHYQEASLALGVTEQEYVMITKERRNP